MNQFGRASLVLIPPPEFAVGDVPQNVGAEEVGDGVPPLLAGGSGSRAPSVDFGTVGRAPSVDLDAVGRTAASGGPGCQAVDAEAGRRFRDGEDKSATD